MTLVSRFSEGGFRRHRGGRPHEGSRCIGRAAGAAEMGSVVDAVNVTDSQSAVVRLGSMADAHLLKQKGIEPVFQLACRDRNRPLKAGGDGEIHGSQHRRCSHVSDDYRPIRCPPKEDRKRVSIEIAAGLTRKRREMCRRIHLMPLGWDDVVGSIVESAELRSPR